jgi:hypothetical protein
LSVAAPAGSAGLLPGSAGVPCAHRSPPRGTTLALHDDPGPSTPVRRKVFYGRVEEVAARRQVALDAAYAAHPERFPNGPPVARRPPSSVAINPLPVDDGADDATAPAYAGPIVGDDSEVVAAAASRARQLAATATARQRDPFIEFSRGLSQSRWHFPSRIMYSAFSLLVLREHPLHLLAPLD